MDSPGRSPSSAGVRTSEPSRPAATTGFTRRSARAMLPCNTTIDGGYVVCRRRPGYGAGQGVSGVGPTGPPGGRNAVAHARAGARAPVLRRRGAAPSGAVRPRGVRGGALVRPLKRASGPPGRARPRGRVWFLPARRWRDREVPRVHGGFDPQRCRGREGRGISALAPSGRGSWVNRCASAHRRRRVLSDPAWTRWPVACASRPVRPAHPPNLPSCSRTKGSVP